MRIEDHKDGDSFTNGTPKRTGIDSVLKLQIAAAILAVLTLVLGVRTAGGMNSTSANIAEQETEIEELETELEEYQKADAKKEESKTEHVLTSEANRELKDSQVAGTFLKKLLTWESPEQYGEIRGWLVSDYGLDPAADPLLTVFMPDMAAEALEGSNMAFDGAECYQVSQDGDSISYFALCKVKNRMNNNSGNGKVGVFYTIDGDGVLGGVSAYALVR